MSEVSICNQALSWLGQEPIISLDDETRTAWLCKSNYGPLRDAVLEGHDWKFAMKRYQLPALVPAPVFGWSNAYPLPSEVLRVKEFNLVDFNDETREWDIENVDGRKCIVTNETTCEIKALARVTETTLFTPLFAQALAARLATDLAIPITNSRSLQQDMFSLFMEKMKRAASTDGTQGKSKRLRSRWLNKARHSGWVGGAPPTV